MMGYGSSRKRARMGRRRQNKRLRNYGTLKPIFDGSGESQPLIRLVAAHPTNDVVALAVGKTIRVANTRSVRG